MNRHEDWTLNSPFVIKQNKCLEHIVGNIGKKHPIKRQRKLIINTRKSM